MKIKRLNSLLNATLHKSANFRSYSCPHFPGFGLNTVRCGVSLRIQSEYGKMRTRIAPNMDTFHVVPSKRHESKENFHSDANNWQLD